MTLKEKVKEVNPECVDSCYNGGVHGCPANYPYLNEPELICYKTDYEGCEKCWNQPFVDKSVETVEKSVETMSHGRDINVLSKYEAAMNYLFKKSVEEDAEKDILITLQTALNYAHEKGKV